MPTRQAMIVRNFIVMYGLYHTYTLITRQINRRGVMAKIINMADKRTLPWGYSLSSHSSPLETVSTADLTIMLQIVVALMFLSNLDSFPALHYI